MKSLIRNDLRWALPLALVGTLVHLFAMVVNYPPASFWIFPENKYLEVGLGFHSTGAMVVGLWALFFDDLFRTREYLLHRPQSFRRIFWLRHAVGLGTVAAWVLLVPTLHLTWVAGVRERERSGFLMNPCYGWAALTHARASLAQVLGSVLPARQLRRVVTQARTLSPPGGTGKPPSNLGIEIG